MKCDGCHRTETRGAYYCFIKEEDGSIVKLGSSCAQKYFGITISTKLNSYFSALSNLGNEPYVVYDDFDGEAHKAGISFGTANDDNDYNDMINSACIALAYYGVEARMKDSLSMGNYIRNQYENCFYTGKDKNTHFDNDKWDSICSTDPKIEPARQKGNEMTVDFLNKGLKFFYDMESNGEDKTDFAEKCVQIGLLVCGAEIQKKQIGKFRIHNFIPYSVDMFFKAQNKVENKEEESKTPIEPWEGEKILDVTIDKIAEKVTRNGKSYRAIEGDTDEGHVRWNDFRGEVASANVGDTVKIKAKYNAQYKSLDDVRLVNENAPEQIFMENGYRFRNTPFKINRISRGSILVEDPTGTIYYISNWHESYSYYDHSHPKFNVGNLSVGDVVNLTATVKRYTRDDGTGGAALIRVKGFEPWVNDEEDFEDDNSYDYTNDDYAYSEDE